MKKFITASALALALVSAGAGDKHWVAVRDATTGTRLLVDTESFLASKEDDTVFIGAMFKFVINGQPKEEFVYATEANTCVPQIQGGALFYRVFKDGKWITDKTYWWDKSGGKMYDAGGQILCDILAVRLKEKAEKPGGSKANML